MKIKIPKVKEPKFKKVATPPAATAKPRPIARGRGKAPAPPPMSKMGVQKSPIAIEPTEEIFKKGMKRGTGR